MASRGVDSRILRMPAGERLKLLSQMLTQANDEGERHQIAYDMAVALIELGQFAEAITLSSNLMKFEAGPGDDLSYLLAEKLWEAGADLDCLRPLLRRSREVARTDPAICRGSWLWMQATALWIEIDRDIPEDELNQMGASFLTNLGFSSIRTKHVLRAVEVLMRANLKGAALVGKALGLK